MPAPDTHPQSRRKLHLVWWGLLTAVLVYGGLIAVVAPQLAEAPGGPDPEAIRRACTVGAIGFGAFSIWWRRHFLSADVPPETPPLPVSKLQAHAIVAWTLCDLVAVCGLVAVALTRDAAEFLPFGAASLALFVLHRPLKLPWGRLPDAGG